MPLLATETISIARRCEEREKERTRRREREEEEGEDERDEKRVHES